MKGSVVKILSATFITHNVRQFRVEKPAGFQYRPGQAVDVSINVKGFEQELRPFTLTSLVTEDYLEFMIKVYDDRDGVTKKLGELQPGDELILHDAFGAIAYKGTGVFLAGGAGVTPFISILRQLEKDKKIKGNILLFANSTENDVICREELGRLLAGDFHSLISHPSNSKSGRRIDRQLLGTYIHPDNYYYICGPDQFVADLTNDLKSLGIKEDRIVVEQ